MRVRLHASSLGMKLFKNNSGVLLDKTGRPVRFGLGNESKSLNQKIKSSDLIGFTPLVVTPEMLGKKVAIFTAIEVKSAGFIAKKEYNQKTREYAQDKFNQIVIEQGGIAGFACNENQLDDILMSWNNRFDEELQNEN